MKRTHFISADYAAQVWQGVMYGVYSDRWTPETNLLDAWEAWDGSVRDFWERPRDTRDRDDTKRANLRARNHIHSDPRKLMLLCRNPFTLVRLLVPRIRAAAQTAKQTGRDLTALLEQALPNNRAQLFGQVIDGMLKAEAERKGWTDADRAAIQTALEFTSAALQATEQRTEIALADLLNAENAPTDLSEQLKMGRDAGIITLTETAVRFNHQLYQEYFATKKLRDLLADYTRRHPDWEAGDALPPRDERLAELFPRWWKVGGWRVTVALLGELEGRTGINRVARWLASYAPSIALEILIGENNDGLTTDALIDAAKVALIDGANQRKDEPNPIGRAAAYRALGLFDADNRKGVNVIIHDGVKLPDIDWVKIPAGEFTYQDDTMTLDYDYHIARYPVTYAQFQTFIDDPKGFYNPRWWDGLSIPDGHNKAPDDQGFKFWNHPREHVSWYDAVAFSRWLSDKLGIEIRLPTEFEWEKAARANTGWKYPYGNDFDAAKSNTIETGIGKTSAVGIFPDGDTPHWSQPVADLSGNVWEWCLTDYEDPQTDATKENLSSSTPRVLRGGGWFSNNYDTRAVSRHGNYPSSRSGYYGFRLVCLRPPQAASTLAGGEI